MIETIKRLCSKFDIDFVRTDELTKRLREKIKTRLEQELSEEFDSDDEYSVEWYEKKFRDKKWLESSDLVELIKYLHSDLLYETVKCSSTKVKLLVNV